MFLLHGDGKYIDLFERVLYNGVLAGVSLAGNTFFYQNPLESNGRAKRTEYFEVACCPANLARMLEQLPGLVYAQTADTIYANLYVGNHADVKLGSRTIKIVEDTRYPWDGDVSLTLDARRQRRVHRRAADSRLGARAAGAGRSLSLRRQRRRAAGRHRAEPQRAGRSAVPLDVRDGYVRIRRNWKRGDTIHLTLPMPARRIVAHAGVKDDEGKIALQRGPLVYAVEAIDNGGRALDLVDPARRRRCARAFAPICSTASR